VRRHKALGVRRKEVPVGFSVCHEPYALCLVEGMAIRGEGVLLLNRSFANLVSPDLLYRDLIHVLDPVVAIIIFCHGAKREPVPLGKGLAVDLIGQKDLV
jgi:hypothetical protein